MQAVLIAYASNGQGWVGWVVLAVIVVFLAVGFFGVVRGWLKAGVIKWRSRQEVSSPLNPRRPRPHKHRDVAHPADLGDGRHSLCRNSPRQAMDTGSLEAPYLGKEDGAMPEERIPGRPSTRRYTPAEREQAVRLVRQLRSELGTDQGTVARVAKQLGYGVESVRAWVNQADVDGGVRPGTTTEDAARIKELEQEVKELRRANEILKKASAYFAQAELDRPPR